MLRIYKFRTTGHTGAPLKNLKKIWQNATIPTTGTSFVPAKTWQVGQTGNTRIVFTEKPQHPPYALQRLIRCSCMKRRNRRCTDFWTLTLLRVGNQYYQCRKMQRLPKNMQKIVQEGKNKTNKVKWLGRQDSNLGMAIPKTAALPLGHAPPRQNRINPVPARGRVIPPTIDIGNGFIQQSPVFANAAFRTVFWACAAVFSERL